MKYLKTFESFSPINEEEEFISAVKDMISGKSAYKTTIKYLESKSKEAEEAIKLYKEIQDSGKPALDKPSGNYEKLDRINRLGRMWAEANKMEGNDYDYKHVETVMKSEWGRKYTGGINVSVGE